MRKRRQGRIYVKDPTNGRLCGDFRDLNGKCEALKQDGRATTDWDVAGILVAERVKRLEDEKRGIAIVGRGREVTLENYALHHLKRKEALKEVSDTRGEQRQLERAVEFFGKMKTLTAITVTDVQDWAENLREKNKGRRGNTTLSEGSVRHHLNALINLYRRARMEKKVPTGFNPVGDWDGKPKGTRRKRSG